MYDPYQVSEARAWGADCILIIMAAVDDAAAPRSTRQPLPFGMDVLVEVHDEDELERALRLKSRLIGINNRDLQHLRDLARRPRETGAASAGDRVIVGESGIFTPGRSRAARRGRHFDLSGRREPDAPGRCRRGHARARSRATPALRCRPG